MQRSVLAVFL